MNARWTYQLKRAARASVLGLAVVACAQSSVQAQDDDDDRSSIWNFDKRLFDGFAKGLGLKSPNDPVIDYRERSPLVVPPTRDLPPPEEASAARRAAAWPVDPDQKRKVDRASKKQLDRRGYDEDYENRALLPSELGPKGGGGASSNGPAKDADVDGRNFKPSELGYLGGLFSGAAFGFGGKKEEVGTFTKEPPRNSLTAPPVGYQTPSPDQPYGVGKETERPKTTPLDPAVGNLGY